MAHALAWAFALAALMLLGAAGEHIDNDPHLPVVPRTADETARIGAVVAPTTDFTQPERFEGLPAGAATVRARTTRDAFSAPSANMSFEGEPGFQGRQRTVPQALGVGTCLDAGLGRAGTALQRAILSALSPEGRPWSSARGAR